MAGAPPLRAMGCTFGSEPFCRMSRGGAGRHAAPAWHATAGICQKLPDTLTSRHRMAVPVVHTYSARQVP